MLEILGFLGAGFGVGWLIRHRRAWCAFADTLTYVILCGFLTLLGLTVGANEQVMAHFAELGGIAILLSVAGVLGSVLVAAWIDRRYFRPLLKSKEEP